jgi:hypothetical protein
VSLEKFVFPAADRVQGQQNRLAELRELAVARSGALQTGKLAELVEHAEAAVAAAATALHGEDADELGLLLDLADDCLDALHDAIASIPAPHRPRMVVSGVDYSAAVRRSLYAIQRRPWSPLRQKALDQLRGSSVLRGVRALIRQRESRPVRRSCGTRASPARSTSGSDDPPDHAGELEHVARLVERELRALLERVRDRRWWS